MTTVLVTDGEQRSALAVVRSLSRAGYRCIVGSTAGRSIAGASRGADREHRLPDPAGDPDGYVEALTALVSSAGVSLLMPMTEASLLAVLPRREQIPAAVPFPGDAVFRRICDKQAVLEAARTVGIRVPDQQVLAVPGAGVRAPPPMPAVAKPARSVIPGPDGAREKVGVSWVRRHGDLGAVLDRYPEGAYPILLQEAIEGPGIGIFVLLWGGRLVASFSHRRIREKPPSGGVSVVRDAEPMDPALLEKSLSLLAALGWNEGVAMVEYKIDAATGEPVLMEINGRFWGSLQLAIDAGVDFPRLLAALASGQEVQPIQEYRRARCRWFWGDVDHLVARWRAESFGGRARALATFLTAARPGTRHEVLRLRDLRPFLRESATWIRDVVRG